MSYNFITMKAKQAQSKKRALHDLKSLPILIECDEEGWYVAECPIFDGCVTQGKTIDEALANIREVIDLIFEEHDQRERFDTYHSREMGIYSLTVRV